MSKQTITVLISGNGSNLQALIDATAKGELNADIIQVISSSSDAYGLTRAKNASIPTRVHSLKNYYKDIPKGDRALALPGYKRPDLIVCAGWMLILAPEFLTPLEDEGISIINLHPALPGAFEGTHAIDRAWKAAQDGEITKGGVMVHYVIQEVDQGEPLIVKEIEIPKGITLEEYEEKVHSVEHGAIVEGTVKALELAKK
ncbi:unnamed protein product [Wickerhamomyces anomalus]